MIGISESDIVANGTDLKAVFTGLLEKMADGDSELITIYYGENADKDQAEELEHYAGLLRIAMLKCTMAANLSIPILFRWNDMVL